jgi:hypothetical protein
LRVNRRVAIDLARRRLKNSCPGPLGEPEHVNRAVNVGLDGLDGIELIVNRRSRARQIEDLVDLDV